MSSSSSSSGDMKAYEDFVAKIYEDGELAIYE
jgi:hypothetical protein